jgi:hypothetical protein
MLSALRYEQLSSMYFREIEVPRQQVHMSQTAIYW